LATPLPTPNVSETANEALECEYTRDLSRCLQPRKVVQHPHCPHAYRGQSRRNIGDHSSCNRPLLIFHHIQKSGGSSVKMVLEKRFRSENAYAGAPFAMPQVACETDILFTDMAVGVCDGTRRPCYYAHSIREPLARWESSFHYFCGRGAESGHLCLPRWCDASFREWVTNRMASGGPARPAAWPWANNTLLQRFIAQWTSEVGTR
jgi:hypothetical protein